MERGDAAVAGRLLLQATAATYEPNALLDHMAHPSDAPFLGSRPDQIGPRTPGTAMPAVVAGARRAPRASSRRPVPANLYDGDLCLGDLASSSVCDTQRRQTIAVLPTTCTPPGSSATVWRACGLPRHDCQAPAVIARKLATKQSLWRLYDDESSVPIWRH